MYPSLPIPYPSSNPLQHLFGRIFRRGEVDAALQSPSACGISDFSAAALDGRVRVVAAKVVGLIKAAPGERTRNLGAQSIAKHCWGRIMFRHCLESCVNLFIQQPQLSQLGNAEKCWVNQSPTSQLSVLSLPRNITIAEELPCFTLSGTVR